MMSLLSNTIDEQRSESRRPHSLARTLSHIPTFTHTHTHAAATTKHDNQIYRFLVRFINVTANVC